MASAFFAEARIPASHDLRTRILFDICRRGGEVVIAELVKEYGGGDSTKGKYVYQYIRELADLRYIDIRTKRKEGKSRGRKEVRTCRITPKGIAALVRAALLNQEHRRQISEALFQKCHQVIDYIQFRFGFDQGKFVGEEVCTDLLDSLLEAIGRISENEFSNRLEKADVRYDLKEYESDEIFAHHFNEYVINCVVHLLRANHSNDRLHDQVLTSWREIVDIRGLDFSRSELEMILNNIVHYLYSRTLWMLTRQLSHALLPTLLILGTPILPLSIFIISYFIYIGSIPLNACVMGYFVATIPPIALTMRRIRRVRNMLRNVTI